MAVIFRYKNGRIIPIKVDEEQTTNEYMNNKLRGTSIYDKINEEYNDENFKYLPENGDEAYDKYDEMSEESYNNLSNDDIYLINDNYVGKEDSWVFNEQLRNGDMSNKKLINAMDRACMSYTAKEDMASSRAVSFDYLRNVYELEIQRYGNIDRSQIANQMKQFIGSEISSKGYTSVSLNESGNGMFNNLAVKMKINMPKGTKMYVADNVGEYEAILGRNTKMVLKKVGFQQSKIQGFENEYGKVLLTYEVINDE